jgi:hypothetical protein
MHAISVCAELSVTGLVEFIAISGRAMPHHE